MEILLNILLAAFFVNAAKKIHVQLRKFDWSDPE